MRALVLFISFFTVILPAQTFAATPPDVEMLKQQVADAERGFAKTMADRDYNAFAKFIAEDAIFFAGKRSIHGADEVKKAWKPFYAEATAPFSWAPETVVVLASGNLALSTGPVKDTDGKVTATFTSIWRLDADGKWRVIFDKGTNACNCATQ
ncbi:MAG: nuclear transport factor 2 family protein [Rhodocyclaceae bacterium]|nr:nuclear transport factor 2 family protein [Rhodocyclaceae bacterium]MBK9625898.1 nuclear transport factor 2 family protein [Rhodocyclaceae bacterium]MBP6109454.1 nuclear transport factor 2 family protein [Rhodocyclaceae bacterium]MBP6278590.1 nuclear transport factor 2 family protein [Rhodocyclaceae bacterium]